MTAYQVRDDTDLVRYAEPKEIYIIPSLGGRERKIAKLTAQSPMAISWSKDGNYIYRKFVANRPHAALRVYSCVDITGSPNLYWLEEYGNHEPAGQWVSRYHESDNPEYYGTDVVWLPRQDQLQEMVNDNINYTIQIQGFDGMLEFSGRQSWEQLWLAFTMKQLYNKTWDKDKWV